ncbi:MAG TPA: PP2C family protein-serine/threonine phosphatase [Terriglobales bacterium]|jgi:serine phosphatase RsbU (regulator of sigma subunit)|nr:PP2C family protein-serine/threonine phosphatase [Terriglobales bacterium]
MCSLYPPPSVAARPAPRLTRREKLNRFWLRISEGLELNQLWSQFEKDARTSYRLYSKDFQGLQEAQRPGRRAWHIAQQFFWAVLEKLSPARRILLLVALILMIFNPAFNWQDQSGNHVFGFDLRLYGGLILLLVLLLEVGDRVVMKRDLEIAREIQNWLLPNHPPAIPGIEIAFQTRPANTVAGDYYDVFLRPGQTLEQDRVLLAVADVAGKSIPAAMLMATFQASLRSLSVTQSALPDLVASVNRYACTNSQGGLRFTTAFLAELDPITRTLTYINAGHNQPMLCRKSGMLERLDAGGLPIGISTDVPYQSGSVVLAPGDWLVIFTDGVVEAVNTADEEYGEQRLLAVVAGTAETTPADMMQRILTGLDVFVGNTPQHDDVTCLLVKVS